MNITNEFKNTVAKALIEAREQFGGTDGQFAKIHDISASVYSRIKGGETEGVLKESHWMQIGRKLNVSSSQRRWMTVRTSVFSMIEEECKFCKKYSKARILVDEPEIGKTYTAKYLARTMRNVFYVDASQASQKKSFVKALAQAIGVDTTGRILDIIEDVKYSLNALENPLVIIDEAGDVDYQVMLLIKELWNATENECGWYMMGADGLQKKFEKGIDNRKVGFRELFSRYSSKFSRIVPAERSAKQSFYREMITQVLDANTENKAVIPQIVNKCLVVKDGTIGGLRRAESLLILNS